MAREFGTDSKSHALASLLASMARGFPRVSSGSKSGKTI